MKLGSLIMEAFSTVLIALVFAVFINIFILQPSTVFGSSMEPTLHNGDFVIMSKFVNTFDLEPDYTDIVIIDSVVNRKHSWRDDLIFTLKYNKITNLLYNQAPEDRYWIKRVIGKSGDTIEIKDGQLFRNGELLKEDYIKEEMEGTPDQKVIIPENYIYVMGDNRNHSADSRIIGCVPIENVIGKLIYKL
ncbi:MAG: signal peptidase I [Peptococcaceae bacterium]